MQFQFQQHSNESKDCLYGVRCAHCSWNCFPHHGQSSESTISSLRQVLSVFDEHKHKRTRSHFKHSSSGMPKKSSSSSKKSTSSKLRCPKDPRYRSSRRRFPVPLPTSTTPRSNPPLMLPPRRPPRPHQASPPPSTPTCTTWNTSSCRPQPRRRRPPPRPPAPLRAHRPCPTRSGSCGS